MKAWFHSFDDVCESYIEMLTDETDITAADSYYDLVYDNYMYQLDSLNHATDTLSMQAPAVVQKVLPRSPTQQVQDDQCNKSVQISTHQQNTQPANNSNPTHPELHPDAKAQLHVSMVTTCTPKELPEQIDWGTPVINQSSPVSPDPHNDQSDLQVQSPTPCTHYSPRLQTIHPARDVIVSTPFQLANTSRSTDHHILNAPLQDHLELKENYTHSQTPRPGRKVKDGTSHIPGKPRPTVCQILSGVT